MRKRTIIGLGLLLVLSTAAAAREPVPSTPGSTLSQTNVIRDRHGNRIGSTEIDRQDGRAIHRDRNGYKVGTSKMEQGHRTFRDKEGFTVYRSGR